ncbi:MAG TPA: hypothetical protein VMC03_08650 [Streptosporangiaceae bacterium]|nr:hypothetical protein [Streptosporangiaceae bacterium]
MFRGRKQGRSKHDDEKAGGEIFQGLREKILTVDPAEVGLDRFSQDHKVWGALLETGYPRGTATLVALTDGTTSLYLSTGGGVIGAGTNVRVAAATRAFLTAVENDLGLLTPDQGSEVPAEGRVFIRALTYQGRYSAEAAEADLGYGRHPLSAVFHAGHGVITELRIMDEARQAGS